VQNSVTGEHVDPPELLTTGPVVTVLSELLEIFTAYKVGLPPVLAQTHRKPEGLAALEDVK
jgi:hypothetical protein